MGRPPPEDGHAARFGARAVLAAVALALTAVPFGLLLVLVQRQWAPLRRLDEAARDDVHRYALEHPSFVTVMKAVSFIGSGLVYGAAFAVVALWLLRRRLPRLALFVVVTVAGGAMVNAVAKQAVQRARPVLEEPIVELQSYSFPSGHAQSAVVTYAVLLLVFLPALRPPGRIIAAAGAVLMVLAIGWSRVALGVHFVSDVLAGYVLGAAWVAATTAAFSAWRREIGAGPVDVREGLEPEHAARLSPLDGDGDDGDGPGGEGRGGRGGRG